MIACIEDNCTSHHGPLRFDIANPLEERRWDELLRTRKESAFFHSSSWARVLHESYGYTPRYFSSVENNTLKALVPVMEIKSFLTGKRGVSLPFTDSCEPVLPGGEALQRVMGSLVEYGMENGWGSIEIRGGSMPDGISPSSFYYGHTLDLLQGEERLFSNLRDSTKRNIKKAMREGVKVSIMNSWESVREFFRLNCLTRKLHGLPPQPLFFSKKYMSILLPGISALSPLRRITGRLSAARSVSISAIRRFTNTAPPTSAVSI